nr:HlyD family secretion protein [uncultured Cohaesibacter sp.]
MDKKVTENLTAGPMPETELQSVAPSAPLKKKAKLKPLIMTLLGLAALTVGIWQGYNWWTVGRFVETTDDAYVKADITTYSAEVAGSIVDIPVSDNSKVNVGDVLVRIDDTAYKAAVEQAEAGIAAAKAALLNLEEEIKLQHSAVEAAQADLDYAVANLSYARTNSERAHTLLETGSGTKVSAEKYAVALDSARASEQKARATLKQAKGQFSIYESQRLQKKASLEEANATLKIAQNNLAHVVIRAEFDGVIGNRGVNLGEYVYAGKKLLSLVPLDKVYVTANFKETQIAHFREGMKASVSSDMLDGTQFQGEIDSLAPASGSEFALLAPQNATGNFTKIVQRIPVKIALDHNGTNEGPLLRPGTSVVVKINTSKGN